MTNDMRGAYMLEILKDLSRSSFSIPTLEKKYPWSTSSVYIYPSSVFYNLKIIHDLHNFNSIRNKVERVKQAKSLIDSFLNKEISLWVYHFGLYVLYNLLRIEKTDDLSEIQLGKRRYLLYQEIPTFRLEDNDNLLTQIWYSLIEENKNNVDWNRNPSLSNVRILFNSDFFGNNYGLHYTEADWIEPISGAIDLEFKQYSKETDPMKKTDKKPNHQGPIILGTDGGGKRHFVNGNPISAGTLIEIKFGKGWLQGRYEWSFNVGDPIKICAGNETIYINEGHIVRF